jgi:hypothetical protein
MFKKLLCSMFLLLSFQTIAGDDHNHEASVDTAPNGGILRDAPNSTYKAELVIQDNGDAKIYLYNKVNSELNYMSIKASDIKGHFTPPRNPKSKKENKEVEVTFLKKKEMKSIKEGAKYVQKEVETFSTKLEGAGKLHRFDLHVSFIDENNKKVSIDFGIDNIH